MARVPHSFMGWRLYGSQYHFFEPRAPHSSLGLRWRKALCGRVLLLASKRSPSICRACRASLRAALRRAMRLAGKSTDGLLGAACIESLQIDEHYAGLPERGSRPAEERGLIGKAFRARPEDPSRRWTPEQLQQQGASVGKLLSEELSALNRPAQGSAIIGPCTAKNRPQTPKARTPRKSAR